MVFGVAKMATFVSGQKSIGPGPVAASVAIILVLIGGALSYLALTPAIGIDDANITQVYAISLAERFEFTYFEGGERVEGSTSLLWTLINAVFFALSGPSELYITLVCFGLTVLTIMNCWKIGLLTFLDQKKPPFILYSALFCIFFLTFLGFFAWSLWALMDITIWLCLLSFILLQTVRQLKSNSAALSIKALVGFASAFGLLTITRPEGIAISLGLLIYLGGHAVIEKRWQTGYQYLIALGVVLATFAAVTLWRVSYFGVPFPNTFYAKVSSNSVEQALSGWFYLSWFLKSDFIAMLLGAFFVSAAVTIKFRQNPIRLLFDFRVFQVLFVLGVIALYTVLGGDHFGSFRFYQPAFLILLPWTAGAIIFKCGQLSDAARSRAVSVIAVIGLMCVSVSTVKFMQNMGGLDREFRIAEDGRLLGQRLNHLSKGTSISIVPAGGTAITYRKGPIYDLMGLNWAKMAHAADDLTGTLKNHGGFVESVFWEAQPDLVTPINWDCSDYSDYPDDFTSLALKGLYETDRFNAAYQKICVGSVAMFVRNEHVTRVTTEMSER